MRTHAAAKLVLVTLAFATAAEGAEGAVEFRTVDVIVTSDAPLAAWQVEVRYDRAKVKILSLEGGEAGENEAWREPPHYDARGMNRGRIVLAAFVDDDTDATTGRARVARLHLQIELPEGEDAAKVIGMMKVRLVAAAEAGGGRIAPVVELTDLRDAKAIDVEPSVDVEGEDEL